MFKNRIAVLVPCYNEEISIGHVVSDFRRVLPEATVYVYDNNSSDQTAAIALRTGAVVRHEPLQGKGNVVRRMFADVDADIFVLVDGDATYDANSAPAMISYLLHHDLDMVIGTRGNKDPASYRRGHCTGNVLLTKLVSKLFHRNIADLLSGYRVLTRRFVKSFPAAASGFETETELTIHALELSIPFGEFEAPYFPRMTGSQSKLSTYTDGLRIIQMILRYIKDEKPFAFFSTIFSLLLLIAFVLGLPIVIHWLETGLVPRFPTAILATGIVILSFLSLLSGIILDSVALSRREARRLAFLNAGLLAQLTRQAPLNSMARCPAPDEEGPFSERESTQSVNRIGS